MILPHLSPIRFWAVCLSTVISVISGSALLPQLQAAPVSPERPNILWITCEDISPNLHCYGDIQVDPHELHNLAEQPQYREVLQRMRSTHLAWVRETVDTGLLPEQELRDRAASSSEYEYARSGSYPLERILETALLVGQGARVLPQLIERLDDQDAAVRYWAANGLANLGLEASPANKVLAKRLADPSPDVQIAAAQALCRSGHVDTGLPVLVTLLEHPKWAVRLASANAMSYLGNDARPAIPVLRKIMTSDDKQNRNLRWVCGHTLRQLGVVDSP